MKENIDNNPKCCELPENTINDQFKPSNFEAPLNMKSIVVTEDVFHLPMSWSNFSAPENIEFIAVTERGWWGGCQPGPP